jgi:short-subunit dehydrogenase
MERRLELRLCSILSPVKKVRTKEELHKEVSSRYRGSSLFVEGIAQSLAVHLVRSLAREVGSRGITVNNVQPGPIDTDLNPATDDGAVPQKAARHSTAMGTLTMSPQWYHSAPVLKRLMSLART